MANNFRAIRQLYVTHNIFGVYSMKKVEWKIETKFNSSLNYLAQTLS